MNKKITWALSGSAGVILLILVLFMLNSGTSKCKEDGVYDNITSKCVYSTTLPSECKYDGDLISGTCYYDKQGIFGSGSALLLISLTAIILLIVWILFMFIGIKKDAGGREEVQWDDETREILRVAIARKLKLPINDGKANEEDIDIRPMIEPFITKNNERFIQAEIEIHNAPIRYASWNGISTLLIPLSRGIEKVRNLEFGIQKRSFHYYIRKPKTRPLYNLQDKNERLLESGIESGDISREDINKAITTPQLQIGEEDEDDDTNIQRRGRGKKIIEGD